MKLSAVDSNGSKLSTVESNEEVDKAAGNLMQCCDTIIYITTAHPSYLQ